MQPPTKYLERPDGACLAMVIHRAPARGTPIVSLRPPQFSHVEAEWQAGGSHHEFADYHPDHPVIRYDPRGTGLSSRGEPALELETAVSDLEAVVDAAGVGQLVLDGISSGALPAFEFAARHPERVEKLIVQNAFLDGSRWWANPVRRALVNIAEVDWELCTETWAWLTWGDERRDRTLRLAAYIRECFDASTFLAMVHMERKVNLRDRASAIACPVIVLNHPHFARMAPESHNAEVALAIGGAQLHTIRSANDRVAAINAFVAGHALPEPAPLPSFGEPGPTSLSERELEVLRFIADGSTNQEIAERLVISVRTVDAHVRHILDKTGSNSRAAATAFAIRHQLL